MSLDAGLSTKVLATNIASPFSSTSKSASDWKHLVRITLAIKYIGTPLTTCVHLPSSTVISLSKK